MQHKMTIELDEAQLARVVHDAVTKALEIHRADYVTKTEAAKYLKVSVVTLWKYIKAKRIPTVMIGPREMIMQADLEAFARGMKVRK